LELNAYENIRTQEKEAEYSFGVEEGGNNQKDELRKWWRRSKGRKSMVGNTERISRNSELGICPIRSSEDDELSCILRCEGMRLWGADRFWIKGLRVIDAEMALAGV
jgi:hypothetical protein